MMLKILSDKYTDENNSQYAYRILRENIMCLHLSPGTAINEPVITSELGISRTPIREALFRLKSENLINVVPHKASTVSLINYPLIHEGFYLRSILEPFAISTAAAKLTESTMTELNENLVLQGEVIKKDSDYHYFFELDEAFHRIIYKAADMEHIWQSTKVVTTHYDRLRYFDVIMGTMRLSPLYDEHKELYNIMIDCQPEQITLFTKKHLSGYKKIQPYIISEYVEYFEYLNI